jgi:hypothetical protein
VAPDLAAVGPPGQPTPALPLPPSRPVILALPVILAAGALLGCDPEAPSSPAGPALPGDSAEPRACDPPEDQPMRPDSAAAYAAQCAPHLGVAPAVSCGDGRMPIYIDGVEVFDNPGPGNCDNPHGGSCMPGSSLQRYSGVDADGGARPEVTWVSLCRRDGAAEDAPAHVLLVGTNAETGATCFFGSGDPAPWTHLDDRNVLVGTLPGPGDPGFDTAYVVPSDRPCVGCHMATPWIHTPWVESAVTAEGEPVVPVIAGPDAPFYVVGAPEWDLRTLHIEGNACLGCHRVGMETVRALVSDPWLPNEEMPPDAPGAMAEDYQALVDCWYAGPAATPGCDWILPPANGCAARVADASYPNASDLYNQGGDLSQPPDDRLFPSTAAAHGGQVPVEEAPAATGAATGCTR